jgi:hypothetical protein
MSPVAVSSVTYAALEGARARTAVHEYATVRTAENAATHAETTAREAANAAASARGVANVAAVEAAIWQSISSDCTFLESGAKAEEISRDALLACPLWPDGMANPFATEVQAMLGGWDDDMNVWRDWYQRRLEGHARGFDVASDEIDIELYRRLVAQHDDWWAKGPGATNADLRKWIEELTPKRLDPEILKQNRLALTFRPNEREQIDLDLTRAGDAILRSPDARDRFFMAREKALAALRASAPGVAQASSIAETIETYLGYLGEAPEMMRPSLAVLYGDELRREIDLHLAPEAAVPLTDRQRLALESWRAAHNAMVAFEPYLSAIERASYGPDVPVVVIELDAIKAIIASAGSAGVASDAAVTAIVDSTAIVPAIATPDDRRRIAATEHLKNFIRATGEFVWTNKGKIGASAGGVYCAATWIHRNIDWLRTVFENHPTMLEIVNYIASLPL